MVIAIGIFFMILSFAISSRLKSKFKKYSQIPLSSGMSGREVAERMLRDNGITETRVTCVPGALTDHYNPTNKTVNLSEPVYHGRSAASAAIAAHECGHAVQHAVGYSALEFRTMLVPIQNVSGRILNFVILASIFASGFIYRAFPVNTILLVIIGCYLVLTLFSFITLPVEFDASRRALNWISDRGIVVSREYDMAKDALKWAAMTYVVAAIGSLVTLMYFIMMFLGGSRR
ncbi:MAG TPA: zinc metallopeptidase [Cyclobacteriaceae bacterium]|nr:zinc metallopeptidase [Cyclobacteriaceae bacterium]